MAEVVDKKNKKFKGAFGINRIASKSKDIINIKNDENEKNINNSEAKEARWYIIHTYTGHENKVADNLRTSAQNLNITHLIQEIKIPTETFSQIKNKKIVEKTRKVFPGYVLVKMVLNDFTWYVVRNLYGCTGFVGENIKPLPLTNEEINNLGVEKRSLEVSFKVGENVRVIDGPLNNFIGKVKEIDTSKNSVKLAVSMFGRETSAELEINQVEPIG